MGVPILLSGSICELDYSNPAAQGVQYINRLFEHERYSTAKNHTPEQRHAYRLEKEKPILDAFWQWISQQVPKKGTRFEKAVNYAQNHKDKRNCSGILFGCHVE